ncbi:hypothetical protein LWI28_012350 [Acer negundo]|uniref:Uncharacterized protein n=1 Tax=Acer negundo TaxID=4023 RepID=A0AAD5I8P6_ACENE|nr:hypothetical protein LWI28_012350 [Acer negundo]
MSGKLVLKRGIFGVLLCHLLRTNMLMSSASAKHVVLFLLKSKNLYVQRWRLFFLASGFLLFVLAPIISKQGMKLLAATRRNNVFHNLIHASLHTFHKKGPRRRFTKQEWEDFTWDSTQQALAQHFASPEFTGWMIEHAQQIKLFSPDTSDTYSTDGNLYSN